MAMQVEGQSKIDHIHTPPLKIQGIKTKLVNFIVSKAHWDGSGRWVEPFLGSGVVLFNINPRNALVTDSNIHIIKFYKNIQQGKISSKRVRDYLEKEGMKLMKVGESHYYEVRDRFNQDWESLDFLFLNRAGFNGLMRFNSKGKYNVPFCRKPERFSKSYITKICNQVAWISKIIPNTKTWNFRACDWKEALHNLKRGDFLYLDPPYYGRHTNYYDVWTYDDISDLSDFLHSTKSKFALSLWYENQYRKNDDVREFFSDFKIYKYEHFYHLGSTESLRNSIVESLIVNK